MNPISSFLAGLLFAAGLAISGMAMPSKVLGFLDVTGDWDPSLAFVMGGAVLVYAPLFRLIVRRNWLLAKSFDLPSAKQVDKRLVLGAALFGVGWGLAGMCPGPAIVVAGALVPGAIVFVLSMIAGASMFHLLDRRGDARKLSTLTVQPDA